MSATTSSPPNWSIKDGRLIYHTVAGNTVCPSAREIWSLKFSDSIAPADSEMRESLARALPDLEFSRFPAEPALVLTGDLLNGIRISLVARTRNMTVPIEMHSPSEFGDQVIFDHCWFPIESAGISDGISMLREHGIEAGKPVSLGQLIWMRRAKQLPFAIIDKTESSPSATGHKAAATETPIQGLKGSLYPYQVDGVSFLRLVADQGLGCIVGDEMGLGKTLQVIALLQAEINARRRPSLVISPATLLENWRRELAAFAPELRVLIHAGAKRSGSAEKLIQFDVVVTSFETAVRDEPMLASVPWNILAIDEAQNIRNPEAQRTLALKRLPRRVSLAVTGTPVENRLSDLWSLADFTLPGLLGKLGDFLTKFEDTATDASRLAPVVAPILLRRRVSEVAKDLPPRIDIPQCIDMTRDMADGYEQVRQQAVSDYGPAAGLVSLQKLRMFCTHPWLLDRKTGDPADQMPKYQRLMEILEEVFSRGEKALIFSSYIEMADILLRDLPARYGGGFFRSIDGRTPITSRQTIVDEFSEFAGAGALVLNPKAAGVGLNITAANHVIHYNPEWNPAVEDQASARAYRRKQTRTVTVHHLYFADTVEDIMVDRLHFKRALAGAAITGHKGDASAEDLVRALAISPASRIDTLE